MSCGVGLRHGSDPTLLWLWLWLEATAAIQPLAETSICHRCAPKKTKDQKKKKRIQNKNRIIVFKNKLMVTKGERWGGGNRDEHIHTVIYKIHITIYKIDNQQGRTVSTGNSTQYARITYLGK